jgi:GNAT superfamily N-acetyltransferase
MMNNIRIKSFSPELAAYFTDLNRAWIERYFAMEPLDEAVLTNPQAHVIDKGGYIFFAELNGAIAGTFALQKNGEDTFELAKMAVDEAYQGLKVGHALMEAAIENAKRLGAKTLVLYSNTKLQPAIHLYQKFGFKEVPLEHSEYSRSNIKMKKELI